MRNGEDEAQTKENSGWQMRRNLMRHFIDEKEFVKKASMMEWDKEWERLFGDFIDREKAWGYKLKSRYQRKMKKEKERWKIQFSIFNMVEYLQRRNLFRYSDELSRRARASRSLITLRLIEVMSSRARWDCKRAREKEWWRIKITKLKVS